MPNIHKESLRKLVKAIANTRADEIDCDQCMDQLAKFVELELDGDAVAKAYPLVKHHLDFCVGCNEEYLALVDALKGLEAPIQ